VVLATGANVAITGPAELQDDSYEILCSCRSALGAEKNQRNKQFNEKLSLLFVFSSPSSCLGAWCSCSAAALLMLC
jgi:hypothetical protein